MKSRGMGALTRLELYSFMGFNRMFHASDKKSKVKGAFLIVVLLFAFGYFLVMSISVSALLAMSGNGRMMPSLAAFLVTALSLVTIIKAASSVFSGRDLDLVLSMPVRPSALFISRSFGIMVENYALASLVMIPAIIFYSVFCEASFISKLYFGLSFLFLPMLITAFSLALGVFVAFISSKIHVARSFRAVFSVLLFAAFYALIAFMGTREGAEDTLGLLGNATFLRAQRFIPTSYLVGKAVVEEDLISFLILALISIGGEFFVVWILSLRFMKLNETINREPIPRVKRATKVRVHGGGVFSALFRKEAKRFFSLNTYVLQTFIPLVIAIGLPIYVWFNSRDSMTDPALDHTFMIVASFLPLLPSALLSAVNIAGVAASLEGESRWLLGSLPLGGGRVVTARMLFALSIEAPFALASALMLLILFRFSLALYLPMLLYPLSIALFSISLGALINTRHPKYDWKNEYQAIKSFGISTTVAPLMSFVAAVAPAPFIFFISPTYYSVVYIAFSVLYFALTFVFAFSAIKSKPVYY